MRMTLLEWSPLAQRHICTAEANCPDTGDIAETVRFLTLWYVCTRKAGPEAADSVWRSRRG